MRPGQPALPEDLRVAGRGAAATYLGAGMVQDVKVESRVPLSLGIVRFQLDLPEGYFLRFQTDRVKADVLDALAPPPASIGTFQCITCNPPYITRGEMETLDRSVNSPMR